MPNFAKKKNTSNVHRMGTPAKANAKTGDSGFGTGKNAKDFKDGKLATGTLSGPQSERGLKHAGTEADTRPKFGETPVVTVTNTQTALGASFAISGDADENLTVCKVHWGDEAALPAEQWEDVTIVAGKTPSVTATHDYAESGNYTAVVALEKANGQQGLKKLTVAAKQAITITATPTPTLLVLSLAIAADCADGVESVTVDWGDGGDDEEITITAGADVDVTATHTFAEAGTYTVVATATGDLGQTKTASNEVTVAAE